LFSANSLPVVAAWRIHTYIKSRRGWRSHRKGAGDEGKFSAAPEKAGFESIPERGRSRRSAQNAEGRHQAMEKRPVLLKLAVIIAFSRLLQSCLGEHHGQSRSQAENPSHKFDRRAERL
jgi:hypothetical protein